MNVPAARLFLLVLAVAIAGPAEAACRQAIAVGLDVSGSVSRAEQGLQRQGMVVALEDPQVRAALLEMPEAPVRIAVYEWSSARYQRLLLPWAEVGSADALDALIAELAAAPWRPSPNETALGAAMLFGRGLLAAQADCARLTLDIAGDGRSNLGPAPGAVAMTLDNRSITVNALVIALPEAAGGDRSVEDLSAYFRAYVLRGPDAFVEEARGYGDFAEAMARKLLKELTGMRVVRRPAPDKSGG